MSQANKERIKKLTLNLLQESYAEQIKLVDKVLESDSVNFANWDGTISTPSIITAAILLEASKQFDGSGKFYEKEYKRKVNKIRFEKEQIKKTFFSFKKRS